MKDQIVRGAFHQNILQCSHASDDTIVIDELGLRNGESRADIAVLNGKFVGYEIKTDSDTLNRLPAQMIAYNQVFDKVFIITGQKHLSRIKDMVPDWWGIYLIEGENKEYMFRQVRRSKLNKQKDSFGIAQLLWKEEVIDILSTDLKVSLKRSLDKHKLYNILVEKCTTNKLSAFALKYLKSRQHWRISPKSLS